MKYCIGVDLGGTNIKVGLVEREHRELVVSASAKTNAPRPVEAVAADIAKLCFKVAEDGGVQMSDISWIGAATPGIIKDGVVILAHNLGWKNARLADEIAKATGKTVFLANDANAAAYAEAMWGSGRGMSSLVAVTLGTGVGGGIVFDGKIWEGFNGFAGELGHAVINSQGRPCGCGRRGCLEAHCSASAIVARTKEAMLADKSSIMWNECGDVSKVSGKTAFVCKEKGDAAAKAVVDGVIEDLAVGVANIINTLQPMVVCIGGGVSREGENLMRPLRERVREISLGIDEARTKVVAAALGNEAGIIGAALLGLQEGTVEMTRMEKINTIVDKFEITGKVIEESPYGNGHINDTYLVKTDKDGLKVDYILQRINKKIFTNPPELMDNFVGVTSYLADIIEKNGGDVDRETLNVIKAKDGKNYIVDAEGEYWRLLLFVTDSISYDKVERPEQFYESAVAFGNFQYLLRDYPADTLNETIVNFHNTPDRFRQFSEAVAKDSCGRLAEVGPEVEFVRAREEFCATLERAHAEGKLPLRVTHNDTKLNNILFDKNTGKPVCIVDLDTIMPGYAVNDFGDSIRFGATTALEDEADLSLVNFDIDLYELYVKGFIEGTKGGLTEGELEMLPIGAIMMTLEVGMRFLADYLNGDVYFKTSRPGHNLDRARNQLKLVSDMEKRLPEMRAIVAKYAK